MTLKNLHIKNFRCFNDFTIDFGERATILFGKNGAGKTSLIHAIHKALSFIMTSDKVYNRSKNSGKKKLIEVRTITSGNPYLHVEGFSKDDNNNTDYPLIDIEAIANIGGAKDLQWNMSAYTTNYRLRPSGYMKVFREFYEWHQLTDGLPVLAFYSDCFPHKEDNKKTVKKKKISDLRNFGYFDWNEVEGCTKEWTGRLESNILNIRQAKDRLVKLQATVDTSGKLLSLIENTRKSIAIWEHEVEAIEKVIVDFSKSIVVSDNHQMEVATIDLHTDTPKLCIITVDGTEIMFDNLPSGYKRLYNIVLDLAYRSYILSGKTSTDIPGIAIIDEVDLHLHPELENVVLTNLMESFPHIQFIVSTHSINTLTSISTVDEKCKILMMVEGSERPEEFKDIYGIDPNSGQQEIMGVRPNGIDLDRVIRRCAYMLSKDLTEQSNFLMHHALTKFGISQAEIEKRIYKSLSSIHNEIH